MGSEDPPPLFFPPEGYHIATCAASGEEIKNMRIETNLAATSSCRKCIVETFAATHEAWYMRCATHESRRWDDETA